MQVTATFDAYHVWLGIAPDEHPPSDYRLLGIRYGEDNPDVISNASDRQMAHVRTFQNGPHAAEVHRLLNELAAATIRLLHSQPIQRPPLSVCAPPMIVYVPQAPPIAPPPPQAEPVAFAVRRRTVRRRSLIPQQDPVVVLVEVIGGGIVGIIAGAALISAMGYDLRQLFGVP